MNTVLNKGIKNTVLVLSILLALVYFFPIWKITLDAPQYPEGLYMNIMINSITGQLDIINELNHYIGMKAILPADIKELHIMPYVLALIILLGVWVWKKGGIKSFTAWTWLLVIAGVAGIIDFHAWEYDYGHHLNPHAAIIIPGMTYQPPLWGTKQLLNFTAHSHPGIGGYVLIGVGLVAFAEWIKTIFNTFVHSSLHLSHALTGAGIITFCLFWVSCSTNPIPLNYGKDNCDFCGMQLDNIHYGCELITKKGKIYKFDSDECLMHYLLKHHDVALQASKLMVTPYNKPGVLISADSSFYLINSKLHSPMGENIASFSNKEAAYKVKDQYGGDILTWGATLSYVRNSMQVTENNEAHN